jgi:hypothetical protein
MSVKVYIWAHSRKDRWGHSSVQIGDDCYISWWPSSTSVSTRTYWADRTTAPKKAKFIKSIFGTDNIYKTTAVQSVNYWDDRALEGGDADVICTIADNVLNETNIRTWWKAYNHDQASYHSIKKNCSTTVIRALRAGGSDSKVPLTRRDTFGLSKYTGWEPTDITTYLRAMAKKVNKENDEKISFNDSEVAETVTKKKSGGEGGGRPTGVAWCEEHDFPLYTCPNC